jgi:hypothetical protein
MNIKLTLTFTLAAVPLLVCLSLAAQQQKQLVPHDEAKAETILKQALEAVGGQNYLNVQTVVGRGQFTQFTDGVSGLPQSFVDYIQYPEKERTEFRGAGTRVVQTNAGDSGWLFDGAAKSIKDLGKAQVDDFKLAMQTSVENLLRGGWRKQGAKLSYVGRREAGLAKRNEVVSVTYANGFTVEYEFGMKDNLPAKVLYKRTNGAGIETAEEDRFAQLLTVSGLTVPFIVDHFVDGKQSSRINYQSLEYNTKLADSIFERPANIKAIK